MGGTRHDIQVGSAHLQKSDLSPRGTEGLAPCDRLLNPVCGSCICACHDDDVITLSRSVDCCPHTGDSFVERYDSFIPTNVASGIPSMGGTQRAH